MGIWRKALFLVSLISLLVIAEAIPPQEPPAAKAEVVQDIFKITANTATMSQPGCPGCPEMQTVVPQFEPNSGFSSLADTLEIDVRNVIPDGSPVSSTNEGGCAITASRGLVCWGSNQFGQLGNGTRIDSATPTVATGVSDVVDVAASARTTCVVTADGHLKCVGAGGWPGLESRLSQGYGSITTYPSGTNSSLSDGRWGCTVSKDGTLLWSVNVAKASLLPAGSACVTSSLSWVDVATDARRVFVSDITDNSGFPTMLCYLTTAGELRCVNWDQGSFGYNHEYGASQYDCDGNTANGFESSNPCPDGQTSYRTLAPYDYVTTRAPNTALTWTDLGISGISDVAIGDGWWGWGFATCVLVSSQVKCSSYTKDSLGIGNFSTISEVEGAVSPERVYVTSYSNVGLCVYGAGTLSCGNGSWSNNKYIFPTEVSTVGVMEEPMSLFYSTIGSNTMSTSKLFIVLRSGILSTDSWIFSCVNCYGNNTQTLAPVTAFKDASESVYFVATGVSGPTDSPNFVPLVAESGQRDAISSKMIKVQTADGTPLKDTTVSWAAPDIPGILRSSSSISNNKTNADGNVRFFGLRTGPITFTLSGGDAGGSYLQAANVTVTVASGAAVVVVPQPQSVQTRKIRVQLPDGTPVPNAIITLRNNYFQYQYSNSGSSTSSWSAQAPVAGLFTQVTCTYCYVPPPTYITGADGSVSFPSYVPASRSTKYDLGISYDDTFINQSLRCTATPSPCIVTTLDQTFTLGFMAAVETNVPDQDPATPGQVDVVPGPDGSVEVPVEIVDPDNIPMEDIEIEAEDVCGTLLNGGLWTGTNSRAMNTMVSTYPGGPMTSGSSSSCSTSVTGAATPSFNPMSAGSVRAMNAGCAKSTKGSTDTAGRAKLVLCPSQSGFFRIRGNGALPSREICVKVNGVECSRVEAQSSTPGTGQTPSVGQPGIFPTTTAAYGFGNNATVYTSPRWMGVQRVTALKRGKKVSLTSFRQLTKTKKKAGKVTITAMGPCTIKGKSLIADKKLKGTCKVTVLQANKGKVKGVKRDFKVRIT